MGEFKTPGVYIKEKNAFGNSVVEAETAIPVFIGLTEKAENGSKSLLKKPTKISSLSEYSKYFGGAPTPVFTISLADEEASPLSVKCGSQWLTAMAPDSIPTLYYNMVLYFANGGGPCYIMSVGDYGSLQLSKDQINDEIFIAIKKMQDITMLLVPEAVNSPDCMNIFTNMLGQCEDKKHFAILDVPRNLANAAAEVEQFRNAVGTTNLQCAAAYYPWLETSVLSDTDIYEAMIKWDTVADDVKKIAGEDSPIAAFVADAKVITRDIHNALLQNVPAYKQLVKSIKDSLNLLPPSAAMAGVYAAVDRTRGVWKAPANVALNYVTRPAVDITDDEQQDLNMPMSGKAINGIRTFSGEGVKVWGARTLDGNSNDWRYVNVRRTMTYLEQSVKNAARAYVFEPNEASTWINLKCMVENFLRSVWKRGGLAGASPEEAYEVHVGLGDTMTAEDIFEGIMRVSVLVAISHPAEFIEIAFQQQMQKG